MCTTATGTRGRCGKDTTTSCSRPCWTSRLTSWPWSSRKGYDDLPVIQKSGWNRTIGLGVVDVKITEIETPELIADRIRRTHHSPAESVVSV